MNNKNDLRIKAKNIREALDTDKISESILSKICESDFFIKSSHIMIFYPLRKEINLLPLLKYTDKNFYLPRINKNELECCPYKIDDKLNISNFKTKEPLTDKINPKILDIIFVPALMTDKNNFRLGYGKGFYDRFLKTTNALSIVPIAKELVVDKIPVKSHDQPVKFVITQ